MTRALRMLLAPETVVLTMPDQDFSRRFHDPSARLAPAQLAPAQLAPAQLAPAQLAPARLAPAQLAPARRRTVWLRAATLLSPLAVTGFVGWTALGWFALDGRLTATETALVGVTVFAFYWVVLSVATAVLGLFWRPAPPVKAGGGLDIAILLPMYGEPPRATIGQAVSLLSALINTNTGHLFSLYILSDTRDERAVAVEKAVWRNLQSRHPTLALHYRRRPRNSDFKSGNIRDWVRSRGHAHAAMLVLDADSVMGADSVRLMADTLAADPGCGLIQTVPRVLPGNTVWQHMQSFASQVYGTNIGRGFALWTGAEANYLGHNAIIRTRAFAASAGLPHLSGRLPRGGVILSHDFVEAALLRRAGWGVRMLPDATESYEDTPETLLGYVRRDRRWCQGNMQHLRLLTMPGLHLISRFHLLQGAMAYLASVWWLCLLVLWALPAQMGTGPDLWAISPLMPVWPELPAVTQSMMAGLVGLMLLGPKLIGVAAYLRDHRLAGGQLVGFAGAVLAEMALSALMAPMLMVQQVRAVLRTLAGCDGGWAPHVTGRPTWPTLIRFHATETLLGLTLLGLAGLGGLTVWLLPVAISLVLAVPLSVFVQSQPARLQISRKSGAE